MSSIGSIKTCGVCTLYFKADAEHAEVCQSCARGEDHRMELDDLVYHDSRDGRIVAMAHRLLAFRGVLTATFKRTGRRVRAGYIASIDWYCGNDLLHFIALANGQFALLPSHKIMFGDGDEPLPDYEKLRAEWRVGR